MSTPSPGAPAGRAWSVAALLLAVADALQARLGAVAVQGELSGFTRAASGHCYFTVKDSDGQAAVLRCAMFRRAAALLDFSPADGQQVLLRGRLTVYEGRGELQCVVESMQRLGAGSLYELFVRLRARLEAAGLFDLSRKRALPAYPRALGVVTSLAAAALHDVLTALARRAPQVRVVVYPCAVQGPQAPAQIVAALALANQRAEVDAVIVCRGGGSLEDLWAFNDESVVRAVAASDLPVVCGVGHETDVTLAELAADLRAPTPTAAAELAAPRADESLQHLQALQGRLQLALRRRLDHQAQRLDRLAFQMGRPGRQLARQTVALDRLQSRMAQALKDGLHARQATWAVWPRRLHAALGQQLMRHGVVLERLALRLDGVDPQHVLARGYAWLEDARGLPVTSAQGLRPGDALTAQWADGRVGVVVQPPNDAPPKDAPRSDAPPSGAPPGRAARPAAKRRRPASGDAPR